MKGNAFTSHRYNSKSVLCNKLGVSILGWDLVWIQGPYPAGKYTNIKIFNKVLRHFLDTGKLVESEDGYVGHADKVTFPENAGNPAENRAMQSRVRAAQETLNRWL
jgi:hypothetical protein